MSLQQTIENIWENRDLLQNEDSKSAIREVISKLDLGELRVAEPTDNGWKVNEWVKKAVVMYFPIQKMETVEVGPFEFHDKIPLKKNYAEKGVRVVPHAIARQGNTVNDIQRFVCSVNGCSPTNFDGYGRAWLPARVCNGNSR